MPIDLKQLNRRPIKGSVVKALGYWRKKDGVQVCGSHLVRRPKHVRCATSVGLNQRNGRCRIHGGKETSGRPVESGLYSKVKLGELRAPYEAMREHEMLRNGDEHLALSSAWIEHLMEMASRGDGQDFRELALVKFNQLDGAMVSGNLQKTREALQGLKSHLVNGLQSLNTMREAIAASDRRQHHLNKGAELQLKADQQLSERTFTGLVGEVVEIILRLAPKEVANAILHEIRTQTVAGGHRLSAGPGWDQPGA